MRTSQLTSPWGMSGNGKFFKTWIKGPMTIRTEVIQPAFYNDIPIDLWLLKMSDRQQTNLWDP